MAKKLKSERDRLQAGSIAEEFRLTQEAKYVAPTLEQEYWKKPNAQKGDIAVCSHPARGIYTEMRHKEGV